MLVELHIKDFVLIDELRIDFKEGLNVLTGETGAGKSIIVKAIDIALGGKAGKDLLRPKSEKSEIELAFHLNNAHEIETIENIYGLNLKEEPVIVFKREILESGRTVSRLNGNITSIDTIKEISNGLIDIHGQHEHQSLLKKENYLGLLDRYISSEHYEKTHLLSSVCAEMRSCELSIKKLLEASQKNERELDFCRYQLKEIEDADLVIGEDDLLAKEYDYIKNGEAINRNCIEALSLVSSNFEDEFNAMDAIDKAISSIAQIQSFSDDLSSINSKLNEIRCMIEDASTNLRHFSDNFSYDRGRLNYVESRLDLINEMKMKYGNSIKEVLLYRDSLAKKLDEHLHSDEQLENLKSTHKLKLDQYRRLAGEISLKRQDASKSLSKSILSELNELNLENATFDISLNTDNTRISKSGYEDVDFLISMNPGQRAKSLSKIASGGEISRIMLAIKVIMSKIDTIDTIIFDEIDTGVSGITAKKVAEKLFKTSKDTQVICITHLPQIAVMGDYHMLIEKSTKGNITTTMVKSLKADEKVLEISRLLDGNMNSVISEDHAKNLIESISKAKIASYDEDDREDGI